MSNPRPSAAIWASAVHAPWPISWAPVSTTPVPSFRITARAFAWNISAGKTAVPRPQPDEQSGLVAHLPRRHRMPRPNQSSRRLDVSTRAGPSRRTACRKSVPPRRSSRAGNTSGSIPLACAISSIDFPARSSRPPPQGTHEQRCPRVEPRPLHAMWRWPGSHTVHAVHVGGRLEEVVESARYRLGVMRRCAINAPLLSVPYARASAASARDAPPDRTSAHDSQHQLDGLADQPSRHDAENLRPCLKPLEPNPPPRKGCGCRMFSGEFQTARPRVLQPWRGPDSACRWTAGAPSHAATIACGSMALWYCTGVS